MSQVRICVFTRKYDIIIHKKAVSVNYFWLILAAKAKKSANFAGVNVKMGEFASRQIKDLSNPPSICCASAGLYNLFWANATL
jgi:hypothetical protein